MSITELSVNPQFVLSSNGGFIGTRKWKVEASDNLNDFVQTVCKSHWPGNRNIVPVSVSCGSLLSDPAMAQTGSGRTSSNTEIVSCLPKYGATEITAQYQHLHLSTCWPRKFTKPAHYRGTSMTLKVRGSGQFLLLSPNGMRLAGFTSGSEEEKVTHSDNCRVIIPLTEFHITCDRLTKNQIDGIFARNNWSRFEGTVNSAPFLGQPAETMLFDSWEQDDSWVPDLTNPRRFKLTAILRSRQILAQTATGPEPQMDGNDFIGWNHDYHISGTKSGWRRFLLKNTLNAHSGESPRYPLRDFTHMFYTANTGGQVEQAGACYPATALASCAAFCDETVQASGSNVIPSGSGSIPPPPDSGSQGTSSAYSGSGNGSSTSAESSTSQEDSSGGSSSVKSSGSSGKSSVASQSTPSQGSTTSGGSNQGCTAG